jgi:hypothetical protein
MPISTNRLLLQAATSPKPGQQGVQKQPTPNKQGKGQAQKGNAKQGNAQASGAQPSGKKGKKGGKGKGKGAKPVDHATLDMEMESHLAAGGEAAAQ